ncbi:PP2C family protein-serine/threonine phosphatase [Trujillonella humicola]|uniref:PP2C family protein-serine/threonine phosphatase n=1 Tax=Trujillonella humicola TaxID=3383699 RepID=UPI003905B825
MSLGSVAVDLPGVPRAVAEQARDALDDVVALAAHAVPGCLGVGVSLAIDGEVHTVALTGDPARLLDELQYDRGDGPCLTALRRDEEVACDDYAVDRRWPDLARAARSAGVSSSLSVPLHAGNGVVGALNCYAGRPAAFPIQARGAVQTLARHGALILRELQQRHEDRTRLAGARGAPDALQSSLLPALPGVACAARRVAGTSGETTARDWHDVFPLPDGAIGLVAGEAPGDGAVGAATTGQVRSVLRSYAYDGASPSLVLDRTDRVVAGLGLARRATVFYGRVVVDAGGALLLYSNAGHPPPLLRRPDGSVTRLRGAVTGPIGVLPQGHRLRSETAVDVPAGSTLLLYTRGLLHGRAGAVGPDRAIDDLARTVSHLPGTADPSSFCEAVLERHGPPERHEDVTVLAVRIEGRPRPVRPRRPPSGGASFTRTVERARRLGDLLAETARESRDLCTELRDGEGVDDDVLARAERCRLLIEEALACGVIDLPASSEVRGDPPP